MNIWERIEGLRRKTTNYTKSQLSEKVGISANSIAAYKESNNAHVRNLDRIVDVLGITLAEFFTLEDPSPDVSGSRVIEISEEIDPQVTLKGLETKLANSKELIFDLQQDLITTQHKLMEVTQALYDCEKEKR